MRIAIVSDIHGNLPALDAVLDDLDRVHPQVIVQGGDLALGGPHQVEVVATGFASWAGPASSAIPMRSLPVSTRSPAGTRLPD